MFSRHPLSAPHTAVFSGALPVARASNTVLPSLLSVVAVVLVSVVVVPTPAAV